MNTKKVCVEKLYELLVDNIKIIKTEVQFHKSSFSGISYQTREMMPEILSLYQTIGMGDENELLQTKKEYDNNIVFGFIERSYPVVKECVAIMNEGC